MNGFEYVKRNYESLGAELEKIAKRVGVSVPKLVSVTKSGSDEELIALASLGASAIGENRPQQLKRRGDLLAGLGLFPELHEIGSLQTNKVKMIADSVAMIHSLDRIGLAVEINKQAERLGRKIPVLIEINSAKEEQKGGVLPEDAISFYESLLAFPFIEVKGLMTMGPVSDDPESIRKYFRLTKKLFDDMSSRYGFGEGATLSMGMSDSYEVAIEEGSTLVRVGRKLFTKE